MSDHEAVLKERKDVTLALVKILEGVKHAETTEILDIFGVMDAVGGLKRYTKKER
jgi:hypothetical protein